MTYRRIEGKQSLLRMFIGEDDRLEGKPLHEAIVQEARRIGIAGCTVFRGASGFGMDGAIHSDFPPDYASDLPIVIEVVDTVEKTAALLDAVGPHLGGALVTEEKLHVHRYRHQRSGEKNDPT